MVSYLLTIGLSLGSSKTGLTLVAQLYNTTGVNSGSPITTGFAEIGTGCYIWHYTGFAAGFRGGVKFYQSGVSGTILAHTAINPTDFQLTTLGNGAIEYVITVTDDGLPVDGAEVWVTSDIAGDNVIASGSTDTDGQVTLMLDAGSYYAWSQLAGVNFTNPTVITVS